MRLVEVWICACAASSCNAAQSLNHEQRDARLDPIFSQTGFGLPGRQHALDASAYERRELEQTSAGLLAELEGLRRGRPVSPRVIAQGPQANETFEDLDGGPTPSLFKVAPRQGWSTADTYVYGATGCVFLISFFFFVWQCVANRGAKMFENTAADAEQVSDDVFDCCECICGLMRICVDGWYVCGPCCHTFCCLMIGMLALMVAYLWALGVVEELAPFLHLYFCIAVSVLGFLLLMVYEVYRHVVRHVEKNANYFEKKFEALAEMIDKGIHPLLKDAKNAEKDLRAWC